ncbi:hypothetical protein [Agrobacterium sp. DE0009]|uniref:hypothetical protein n=1 Tax=Agrobacterium sp. DE0009 TaxID=2587505 RepID=UPI0011A5A059|nr:hypothetical protein [Agrobacterium sp. DE0009]
MPIVTGLFEHEEGARRAIQYLEAMGVDRRIIKVETYDHRAAKNAGHTPEKGEKGGIDHGKIVRADVSEKHLAKASEAFINLARRR